MGSCEEVAKRIEELAALPAAELPSGIRDHLAGCPVCTRSLAVARVTRGLLAAAADTPEPPAGFAERVVAARPLFELDLPTTAAPENRSSTGCPYVMNVVLLLAL